MMESERQIEKLLRAFAKKRRDDAGAPSELHPATRRMLQGEIARRAPKPPRENFRIFSVLRPRPAFALAAVVVVCLGAALWLSLLKKEKTGTQLAQAERAETYRRLNRPAVQPAPPPAAPAATPVTTNAVMLALRGDRASQAGTFDAGAGRAVADKDKPGLPGGRAGEQTASLPASRPEIVNEPTAAGGIIAGAGQFKTADGWSNRFDLITANGTNPANQPFGAFAAAPGKSVETQRPGGGGGIGGGAGFSSVLTAGGSVPSAKDVSLGGVREPSRSGQSINPVSQRFVQVDLPPGLQYRLKALAPPSNVVPVLADFQVEQNGDEIQVVDRDGSVYRGRVEPEGAETKKPLTLAAPAPATEALSRQTEQTKGLPDENVNAPAAQNYFFRVAGTNRSLNQNVVFMGNLVAITNGPFTNQQTIANTLNGVASQQLPSQNQLQSQWQNSRISGKAVIAGGKEIEINAVPVAP